MIFTGSESSYISKNVELHGSQPVCVRKNNRGRDRTGEEIQGEVRLLTGVPGERIHQQQGTLRYYESGATFELQGIWDRYS